MPLTAILVQLNKMRTCVLSVRLFVSPWTVAHQAPLVLGDSPGQNTGVGCHALLQGIFPTQRSNPDLLHCRWVLYHLSHQGSPHIDHIVPINIKFILCAKQIFCYTFFKDVDKLNVDSTGSQLPYNLWDHPPTSNLYLIILVLLLPWWLRW